MRKILLYVNYITIAFLILVTSFAFVDTLMMYEKYGFSYEVVTIIDGKSATKTITVWEKVAGAVVFLGLCFLLLLDTFNLMEKRGLE